MPRLSKRAEEFVARPLFGKLATVGRDGSPQLTPVWYLYEGGKFLVNTAPGRVKSKNIGRDPRVALLVDDGYTYVAVKGRAQVSPGRDSKSDIETLAVRYHGKEKGQKLARGVYWKMERVTFEIVPESVVESLD